MASTYSTNLGIELIGTGDQAGAWGNTTNTNLGTLIEQSISGYVTQAVSDDPASPTTLTIPNGASGIARNMYIELTGALTAARNVIVPANKKLYFIYNNTTGGYAVTVKVTGQTGVSVPNGAKAILVSNGTDIVPAYSTGNITFSSNTISTTSGALTIQPTGSNPLLVNATSAEYGTSSAMEVSGTLYGMVVYNDNNVRSSILLWNKATSGDNYFASFLTEGSPTVRGTINYNRGAGIVAYNTSSDYRLKDIYGPLTDSGVKVDALNVYLGKMKTATMERPMMLAHEVQAVAPYAVTGTKDAVDQDGNPVYQQVDFTTLVPLLIAEIQSLRARVVALEAK